MEYKRLGDLCNIVSGGTPSRSKEEYWKNGTIPWIKIGNIKGKFVNDVDEYITDAGLACSSAKMLSKDTILYTIFATLGEVGILEFDACTNQAIAGITIKNDKVIKRDYLFYYLKSKKKYVNDIGRGVAQNNINMSILRQFVVPLPTLEMQNKIIVTLEQAEKIIAFRRKQLQQLDELVKSRFVEMFGTLYDNKKSLDVVTIEEICTIIKDGTHQTPTYTEDKLNGFKFLSSKDVMTQRICWDDTKYIPAELHEKLYSTIQPRRNDILMSKNGVNYGVAAVNDTDEVFDIYVSLALLRPRLDKVNPIYFRCAINNPDTKHQFDSSIKGIGVPNLHLGEIKKTKILLPPMSQQNEFVAFAKQVDKSKVVVQKALDEAQTLLDSLMQEYFG